MAEEKKTKTTRKNITRTKKKMHPNSLANIAGHAGQFATVPGLAKRAALASVEANRKRAMVEQILDAELNEAVSLLTSDMTQQEYMNIARNGKNQLQRVLAREMADSRTAFAAVQWAYDRLLGRSLQQIRQQSDVTVRPEKPTIVFKDIEGELLKEENKDKND